MCCVTGASLCSGLEGIPFWKIPWVLSGKRQQRVARAQQPVATSALCTIKPVALLCQYEPTHSSCAIKAPAPGISSGAQEPSTATSSSNSQLGKQAPSLTASVAAALGVEHHTSSSGDLGAKYHPHHKQQQASGAESWPPTAAAPSV